MILYQKLINIARMTKRVKESSVMHTNRLEKQENRIQKLENRNLSFVGIWILIFGFFLTGCNPQEQKSYNTSTVSTYAELTLLYEKEKMVNKENDSTYQTKVKDFFASRGLRQEEFKKNIAGISGDIEMWKMFIQDVSSTMDSLKNVEATKRLKVTGIDSARKIDTVNFKK